MPRTPAITAVGLQAHEVLLATRPLTIEASVALDPETAQAAIRVVGARGRVRLSRGDRRATWTPAAALRPGTYLLVVDELVTAKGVSFRPSLRIPFSVAASRGEVARELAVQGLVRLSVGRDGVRRLAPGEEARGKSLELIKASHRRTGRPVALAFDERGRAVDGDRLLRRVARAAARRLGKLHPSLHDRIRQAGPAARQEVAIWLKAEVPAVDKAKLGRIGRRAPEPALEQRRAIQATTARFARQCTGRWRIRCAPDDAAPVVFARMTAAQIRAIAKAPQVLAIFPHDRRGIDDLTDSLDVSNADDVIAAGTTGSGVRVAVWEDGPDDTTDLEIEAFYDTAQSATSDHARLTCGIIKNTRPKEPHGYAPDCDLYSANDKALAALRWAVIDQGCTVVSQSFHRDAEQTSDSMSFDDVYKDWLVLHWPYPTIVQAAGNSSDPDVEYVNHKGFNSVAVGSHDDDAGGMAATSVLRNPASAHGDRELPEISANGIGVTAVGVTKSGTSFAAPAVAGVAALIQSRSTALRAWPEGCRAILFASARRIGGGTWWQDVSARTDVAEGAGAVDAEEATRIAGAPSSRNNSATRRGWHVGTLRTGDFGSDRISTFRYRLRVPPADGTVAPRRVKVALAWDSRVWSFFGFPFFSSLGADFDLMVHDAAGTLVGYSGSWDNSYEIVDFQGASGATYTIRIRRWSGTDEPWYGIAWTVV